MSGAACVLTPRPRVPSTCPDCGQVVGIWHWLNDEWVHDCEGDQTE